MTVNSNQWQSHNQLLRHGMLNWVTRGVYLGYQRNYLELHVDDVFLPDDSWDPVTNTTNYDPDAAIRMSAADVAKAVQWSQQTGLKLDMVYNGAGNEQYDGTSDPLLAPLQQQQEQLPVGQPHVRAPQPRLLDADLHPEPDHPEPHVGELERLRRRRRLGRARHRRALGPGEHVPGNPGTIDPPTLEGGRRRGRHARSGHVRVRRQRAHRAWGDAGLHGRGDRGCHRERQRGVGRGLQGHGLQRLPPQPGRRAGSASERSPSPPARSRMRARSRSYSPTPARPVRRRARRPATRRRWTRTARTRPSSEH